MLLKLIFFTIFLHAIHNSASEHHRSPTKLQENQQIDYDFTLVSHQRLHQLEKSLQRFLSKLTNSMNGTITLRARSRDSKDVQVSIRRMCDSVRGALAKFAEDCRLMNTVRSYKQNTNNDPLSDDWFSESVLQGAYIFRDVANVVNEVGVQIRSQFRDANATKHPNQPESHQFLGVIHNAADFTETLSQCLQSTTKSRRSPTSRAILNLAKNPPKSAVDIFRSNLISRRPKTFVRSNNQKYWHVVLCLSIMNNEGSYESCMNDLRKLDECLTVSKQRSSNKRKSVDANSWVKAIERLSDCEIQADKLGQVSCKSARGKSRRIKQKVRYMFERILDRKIRKESALHRAATDLGDVLSTSEWGRKLVDELLTYFGIFDDGQRKVRLVKDVGTPRYKELSEALQTYRKGMLMRTFNTINKLHRSIANFEQFLIHGIKDTLNEAWQSHLKVLSSLMEWMTKLLELYSGAISENGEISSGTLTDNQMNENESSNSDDSEQSMARSKPEIMEEADASMKSLIESMNRVSRYRSTNDSMLSCLANNLLLVTMFMETIGFVSTLYCFDYSMKEEDTNSRKRNRPRRFVPFDYNEVGLVSQDLMLLESRGNHTSLIVY
ncbi:uncharacterized protein LOC105661749 [Megachile rotundata]|uniref:uncharacterized protein LOC105661749 n=1 Tax=Megachile rotundata TaxID=143995 RepID=UPI003FD015AA